MKLSPLVPLSLVLLTGLLCALPLPRIEDHLTPILDTLFSEPTSPTEHSSHKETVALPKPLPSGTLVRATVVLSGGPDIHITLANGGPRTARKKGIEPPLDPTSSTPSLASVQTWQTVFVVPPGPGPLTATIDWQHTIPLLRQITLATVDPRYTLEREALQTSRILAALATLLTALLLLRRRLSPERFATFLGRTVLPLGLSLLIAIGLFTRWDGTRGPHGQVYGFNALCNMGSIPFARATPQAQAIDFKVNSLWGYDGLQYAEIALDPLLLDHDALKHAIDAPSYRAKRIVLPALAWLIGLGHGPSIIQAEALLNVAAWVLLLLVLRRAFPPSTLTLEEGAAIAALLLSVGVLESIRRALTDLPATALLACAIHLTEKAADQKPGTRLPLLFATAVLTRESVLLSLPLFLRRGLGKANRPFLLACVTGALAVGGWFTYVTLRFPDPLAQTTHNFTWPLLGLAERIALIPKTGGWDDSANRATLLALVSLGVQALYLLLHRRTASAAWRAGILSVPLFFCLGQPVLEEYYAMARALLPLTLAFHWELARTQRGAAFWLWALPANLYLGDGLIKYLFTLG